MTGHSSGQIWDLYSALGQQLEGACRCADNQEKGPLSAILLAQTQQLVILRPPSSGTIWHHRRVHEAASEGRLGR